MPAPARRLGAAHKQMGGAARHMAKKVTKEQYETLQSEVRESISLLVLLYFLYCYFIIITVIRTNFCIFQYLACQRKLQSKDEAVKILRKELELYQEEKEEYGKLMNHMVCDCIGS